MSDASVTVAWVHSAEVAYSWCSSMLELQGWFHQSGQTGRFIATRYGTGGIVEARNKTAERFLAGDEDYLMWVDTDMGFRADAVSRLLEVADPELRPVVGGLCFAQKEVDLDGFGGFSTFPVPTVYRWAQNPDGSTGFVPWHGYPRDRVVQVEGTGAAFVLIHRGVLTKIADKHGPNWYGLIANPNTGGAYSEDLSFCIRCAEVGVPIHVDTSVKTTHLKNVWLSEVHYDMHVGMAAKVEPSAEMVLPAMNRAERRRRAKAGA